MSDNPVLEYRKCMRELFNTAPGEDALRLLQGMYVETIAFSKDPVEMAYRLGQKELIQGILKDATSTDEEFEATIVGALNEY